MAVWDRDPPTLDECVQMWNSQVQLVLSGTLKEALFSTPQNEQITLQAYRQGNLLVIWGVKRDGL